MEHDIQQAREFIAALTGSQDTPVTWQVYYDPKGEQKRPDLATHFVGRLNDNISFFEEAQSKHCGIYVGINITDGKGRRNENVVGFRAVFADFDDMVEPAWPIRPHIVTKRDDLHGHAIWITDGITTADEFTSLQMRLAVSMGTDTQVHDPARVLRLPGFNHYKDPDHPKQYKVVLNEAGRAKYSVVDIITAFKLTPTQSMELDDWLATRDGSQNGSGYLHDERYIKKFTNWLKNSAPPAVQGSGTLTVYKVAAYGHDHGVPLADTKELMWENYNDRCIPPWNDGERGHFNQVVERAYKYPKSAAGCKTAIGVFSNTESLPPPINGWENNSKINDDKYIDPIDAAESINDPRRHRLSKNDAEILLCQLTIKSPHYDLARAFDGVNYEGRHLLRCDKIFYEYNGCSWDTVSDGVIKAMIQRFFADFKPNDTFTRGIFSVLCDMVNIRNVENGTWIGQPEKDCSSMIIFENGIVDIKKDIGTVNPHTSDLFCFNHLPYKYDTSAECPKWHEFLNDLWGEDTDLKNQLQELIGYCMSNDIRYHKFALFIGKSRAGKGVITDMIRDVVGHGNTSAPTLSTLHKDEMLHAMSKSTVALIPDAHNVSFNSRDEVLSKFKGITGGDPQTFNIKFKDARTQIFKCRFILSTNGMPEFADGSGALANRALVFPFDVSFAGRENINLRKELAKEVAGVAQWALRGLARLNRRGRFTEAEAGLIEKEEIREDMSPLSKFIKDMCVISDDSTTYTQVLYAAYNLWALTKNIKNPLSEIQFSKLLRGSDLPIHHKRPYDSNRRRVGAYSGIRLADHAVEKMSMGDKNVVKFPAIKD